MTLRVTLEVIPFGKEEKKYKIGHMDISNMGEYTDINDAYKYNASQYSQDGGLKIESVDGSLIHFRDEGPWKLVKRVLSLKGFTN